jgi:hypothetical protein
MMIEQNEFEITKGGMRYAVKPANGVRKDGFALKKPNGKGM